MISAHPRDRYFQHILVGWNDFVAPLTPPNVSDVPHLKCAQEAAERLDSVPESVGALLWEIAKASSGQLSEAKTFSLWSKAWPTMWIWMQHMYQAHHAHRKILKHRMDAYVTDVMEKRYQLFGGVFMIFVDHNHPRPMVTGILASHPGIFRMMADMWIREGTDKNASSQGFRSGVFADPRHTTLHARFKAQVLSACGSAKEFVHILCQRIERNIGQEQRDYDTLTVELTSLLMHISVPLPPEDSNNVAPAMYASSRVATMLMQAWAHITSSSFTGTSERRDELLRVCAFGTFSLVQRSPQAYERLVDILDHDFLLLFLKSVPMVRSSSKNYEDFTIVAVAILEKVVCPATIHRKMLCSMGRFVSANQMHTIPRTPNPRVHESWAQLNKLLNERQSGYKRYTESSRTILLCGNEKVSAFRDLIWSRVYNAKYSW